MKNEIKNIAFFVAGAVVLKVVFFFLGMAFGDAAFSPSNLSTSVLNRTNIVALTNQSRKSERLHVLKRSKKLNLAAQKKADDMAKNQYFDHVSPTGKRAWDFMDEAKYAYLYAGENLALNFHSAESVTKGWLMSPGHRANILGQDYLEIGVGMARGTFRGADATFVVQMFGKSLGSYSTFMASSLKNQTLQPVQKSLREIYGPEDSVSLKAVLKIAYASIILLGLFVWRKKFQKMAFVTYFLALLLIIL